MGDAAEGRGVPSPSGSSPPVPTVPEVKAELVEAGVRRVLQKETALGSKRTLGAPA